ncbi:MAG TPA: translocation/assembly module TamB domain-containing protein [Candidatus Eisenbacteria bacterium]|nr:translocation/assembly module TamB domain-containing protein [Candidatus Eisenbacteria bacterium]
MTQGSVDPDSADPTSIRAKSPRWRWTRWLLRAVLLISGLLVVLFVAMGQPPIATAVVKAVLARVHPLPGSSLGVTEVRGDWWTSLEIRGLRLTRGDTLIAGVEFLRARYGLASLLTGELRVRDLDVEGLVLTPDLWSGPPKAPRRKPARPPLTLARLLRGRFYDGPAFRIDQLTLRGVLRTLAARESSLTTLSLDGRRIRMGRAFSFAIDSLRARRQSPGSGIELDLRAQLEDGRFEAPLLRFRGDSSAVDGHALMTVDRADSLREARLVLDARPLDLHDLAPLLPRLNLGGALVADIDLRGTRRDRLSGTVAAATDGFHVGAWAFEDSRLSATLSDGRSETSLSGSFAGARIDVRGWIRPFDLAPTYDLQVASDRLPAGVPGAAGWNAFAERASSRVALRVQGTGYARPVAEVQGGTAGEIGRLDIDGRIDLTRGLSWSVRRLRFAGLDVARMTGRSGRSSVSGTLTTTAREATGASRRLTADLDIGPSTYGAWRIDRGRARATIDGASVGASLELVTQAGSLDVDSLTGRWEEGGVFRLIGARFRDLDLEKVTASPAHSSRLTGRVSGRFHGLRALMKPPSPLQALRDGRASGEARVDLEPSRWRRQNIGKGSVALTLSGGVVRFQGSVDSDAGVVDLAGRARPFDATPGYWLERGRFSDLDLAGWTGSKALRSRLTGSVTASGRPGGSPGATGTWQARLRLDRSSLGQATLAAGDLTGSWSEGLARLDGMVLVGEDTVSARGEMLARNEDPRGHAELSIPLAVLAAWAGDTARATGSVTARARFIGLAPRTATLDGMVVGQGTIGLARLDSLFAGFHLRQGTLALDTLIARSNVAVAAGSGHIALFDSTADSRLRVTLRVNDLAPIRRLVGADTAAVDTATVDLQIFASRGVRRFDLRSSLRSLAWNQARLQRAHGSVSGELDAGWRPLRTRGEASLGRLRGVGLVVNDAVARVEIDPSGTRFDLTGTGDERHRLRLIGSSLTDSLGQHLALDKLDIRADSASWALARPAAIDLGSDRFDVRSFELRSATGRISARGVVDRRGQQDFQLDLENVGLDVVSTWLGRPGLSGVLNAHVALEGAATAPRGSGSLELRLLSDDRPAGRIRSRLAWDGTRLGFGGGFATPQGDSMVWTGDLPLALSLAVSDSAHAVRVAEGDVDVRLAAQRFPLAAFSALVDPRTVGDLEGTLDLDVRLKGTSRAVSGQGRVDVTGAAVPLPGLGVTYEDIDIHGAFQGDRLVVNRAHATSSKGSLDATGSLRFIGVTRVEPNLRIDSRKFVFVESTDLRAVASGKIDLTGTLTSPLVKGNVTIENSNVYLEPAEEGAMEAAAAVQLTEADLRMLEETFGDVKTSAPNAALQLYDASDLDLAIRLERNNWVRQRARPKLAVALTGDVRLRKAPHGEPQLFGRIEPLPNRGYVEQFARSFDIKGGEVLLNGSMKDHRLDLQAQYKPPTGSESDDDETVINLDVEGTPEKPRLILSSEPAMSEVEIISFIATGQSPDKPATSDQSASLAKDIGLSQVTGFAEEAAQEAIGLDVLQVRFDALQGATLVAGRYLDNQLYVGFRQPLQYKESGTPEAGVTNKTSFEVEYALYRWLLLNLQGETSKVRSFFRVRHAY